jgi:hypothetical protein
MVAFVVTLAVLGLMLLIIRALLRRSQFAIGLAGGAVLALVIALVGWTTVRSDLAAGEFPLWLPPLPFALVAITLFGFGMAAWFLSED